LLSTNHQSKINQKLIKINQKVSWQKLYF